MKRKFECAICHRKFSRKATLTDHKRRLHESNAPLRTCPICRKNQLTTKYIDHLKIHKPTGLVLTNSVFEDSFVHYQSILGGQQNSVDECFPQDMVDTLTNYLHYELARKNKLKFFLYLTPTLVLTRTDADTDYISPVLHSQPHVLFIEQSKKSVQRMVYVAIEEISQKVDDFVLRGSGWIFLDGNLIELNIYKQRL